MNERKTPAPGDVIEVWSNALGRREDGTGWKPGTVEAVLPPDYLKNGSRRCELAGMDLCGLVYVKFDKQTTCKAATLDGPFWRWPERCPDDE